MKSINYYIIQIDDIYDEEVKTTTGLKLVKHFHMAQGFDFHRSAKVVMEKMDDTLGIQEGDEIIFHHNMLNRFLNHEGIREYSDKLVDDEKGWYKIPPDAVYGYVRDGKFTSVDGFAFIAPIREQKYESTIYVPNNEQEVLNEGIVVYGSPHSEHLGLEIGDRVIFQDEFCKYPMTILGEELWRMKCSWLVGKRE